MKLWHALEGSRDTRLLSVNKELAAVDARRMATCKLLVRIMILLCQGLSQDHKYCFVPPSAEDKKFFKATFQEVTLFIG